MVEQRPIDEFEPVFKPGGRGTGRGSLLAKALSRGKTLGIEDSDTASSVSQPSSVGPSGDKPLGLGRGSFLSQLKLQRDTAAANAEDLKLGAAALGGRGKYIEP